MKWLNRTACPLCQSGEFTLFIKGNLSFGQIRSENFKITDKQYGTRWNFSKCRQCGFVFSNPYISQSDINQIYTELEDQEYSAEAGGRARNFRTILKRLDKMAKPGQTLLDIGAASGIFLNEAIQFGYQATGIEPSAFLVEEAKRRYGLQLFQGTLDTFRAPGQFAVVTLIDILEHLTDPDEFMSKLAPRVEPGGILIIVTPDIASLAARISGSHWWHYRIAHVNFFTLKSLAFLLEKFQFQIILKKRYAWNFSIYYLLSRIFHSLERWPSLQKACKSINFKLQLLDSWEIYARKSS